MSDKIRNFRSSYYDKVGFRGVEEKKSLEKLINEKPMDREKLSKFCLRFTLPSIYREYVWQVLLGVLPTNAESHASVTSQREDYYSELVGAGGLLLPRGVPAPTLPPLHALMFLATEETVGFDVHRQVCSGGLVAVASLFLSLASTESAAFFIFRNFTLLQRRKESLQLQREVLEGVVRREDGALHLHLGAIGCWGALPLAQWGERLFAEQLHESSLARICDKVIGGSSKILVFVAAALLVVRRHTLLQLQDTAAALTELQHKNPEDVSEVVVNKALELYYAASH